MSLATMYRPKEWDDVVGQDSAVMILKQQINTGEIHNCYIFSGATGSGKTTCARIFANKINDGNGSPIEIDAASNNGVDNVRNIVDHSKERAIDSKYKVYIIDEAHQLSNAGWNAFLKTIEEPPKYTIFIFCTTEVQKIPQTIKNRCMRFNFTRIPSNLIQRRLEYVLHSEGFSEKEEICSYISRICNGEMRNALSLLETCISYPGELSIDNVTKAIGNFSYSTYFNLVNAIIDGDFKKCNNIIDSIYFEGNDLTHFINSFLDFVLDATKYIICKDISVTKIPMTMEDDLKFSVGISDASKCFMYITDKLLELKQMLKNDSTPKVTIEIIVNQMCRLV